MKILSKLSGSMMLACLATVAAWAGAPEPLVSSFGPIGIQNGMPVPASISTLYDERDYQQAVQSYLWALPAVSFAQWQHEQANRLGAKNGDLIVYRSFSDKKGILTANATTPYVIAFVDLSQTGPMVIEMPAGHTAGAIGDVWQREMASLGETGSTGDKGGRYLVMPPGYPVPEDADGYTAVISDSVNVLLGFRVLDPVSGAGRKTDRIVRYLPVRFAEQSAADPDHDAGKRPLVWRPSVGSGLLAEIARLGSNRTGTGTRPVLLRHAGGKRD